MKTQYTSLNIAVRMGLTITAGVFYSSSALSAEGDEVVADKNIEKIIKNSCFGNYKKLINTLEWLDDKNINIDIAEKLILVEYQQYIQKNN